MKQHTYKVGTPLRQNRFQNEEFNPQKSPSNSSSKKEKITFGRFIPTKISTDLYQMFLQDFDGKKTDSSRSNSREDLKKQNYSKLLTRSVSGEEKERNLLQFNENKKPKTTAFLPMNQIDQEGDLISQRKISLHPYRKLEAPNLIDDFYLNVLDWSSTNLLALGLTNKIYTWSPFSNKSLFLWEMQRSNGYICSVAFHANGEQLAVADSLGEIAIYDFGKERIVLRMEAHSQRIGSLAWNGNLLASGSRDRRVNIWDLRVGNSKAIANITAHKQEICGLKWSFDEHILASGGNDNRVNLWSLKTCSEIGKLTAHTAAVKALAWSPYQYNLLVTGGGTSDRTIRFWNVHTLKEIDCLDSGSQVCNISFAKNVNELVTTHGYSLNQINIWKVEGMKKIATLTGHTMRVLYLATSPCGENIVTGAGDETLMFWNVFPGSKRPGWQEWDTFGSKRMDLR